MKYFDTLTQGALEALVNRGVDPDSLLYCLKCDMNGEGLYYDTYLTFDSKNLYIVSGYDRLVSDKKKFHTVFDFKEYNEYSMEQLKELYVDRYRHTCRLMGKMKAEDGASKEREVQIKTDDTALESINREENRPEGEKVWLSRFSAGFSEKAEQTILLWRKTAPSVPSAGRNTPTPTENSAPTA